jgi:sulfite exporter TauE/SafE
VAIKATASGDPLYAAGLMLCFGLGTIPTMFLVTTTGAVIGERARGILARLAGIAVIILGLWTIYEGVVFYDIMRGLAN